MASAGEEEAVIANQPWQILTRFTARDGKCRNGWEWIVPFRNGCSLVGHRYYSTERNAKRAANRVLARLFSHCNEMP